MNYAIVSMADAQNLLMSSTHFMTASHFESTAFPLTTPAYGYFADFYCNLYVGGKQANDIILSERKNGYCLERNKQYSISKENIYILEKMNRESTVTTYMETGVK